MTLRNLLTVCGLDLKGACTVFSISQLLAWMLFAAPCFAATDTTIQELLKEYQRKPDAKAAAISLFEKAVNKIEYDKLDESALLFDRLTKMDPKCAGAFFGLSTVYMFKEDYKKAIENADKALRLRPKEPRFFHIRGLEYIALLDYPRAIADFSSAVAIDPQRSTSLNYRAASYGAIKKYDEAIRDYEAALKIDPQDEEAMYARARMFKQKCDWKGAVKAYDYILSLSSVEEQALVDRGLCKMKVEDYKGAIKDFTSVLRLGSESPALIYKNRAIAYERLGMTKQAQRDRARASGD